MTRFYVMCAYHPGERIYIDFDIEPETRLDIPPEIGLICQDEKYNVYSNRDVIAEIGIGKMAAGGAIIGGLLYLIDPILGIIGIFGVAKREKDKVEKFNNS